MWHSYLPHSMIKQHQGRKRREQQEKYGHYTSSFWSSPEIPPDNLPISWE
jgi:hypothetical protein